MKLIRRLIELAFVILVFSFFMKNKDVEMNINYYGLSEPIRVAFWELVTFCVSLGVIIAAIGDLITQLGWVKERKRMVKTDKEHQEVLNKLNERTGQLEAENKALRRELEEKIAEKETPKKVEPSPYDSFREDSLDSAERALDKFDDTEKVPDTFNDTEKALEDVDDTGKAPNKLEDKEEPQKPKWGTEKFRD
jgi:hypothetical protein